MINLEYLQFADLITSLIALIVAVVIGIVTITLQIKLYREERRERIKEHLRNQKQLLNSLVVLINEIRSNLTGHLEELSKQKPVIPSYFITSPNAYFYVSKLDSNINHQSTAILKKNLIEIQVKVDNINRLIELAQNAEVLSNMPVRNLLRVELIKEKGYYSHLNNLINSLDTEKIKLSGI